LLAKAAILAPPLADLAPKVGRDVVVDVEEEEIEDVDATWCMGSLPSVFKRVTLPDEP
jgi:hypothetical protein